MHYVRSIVAAILGPIPLVLFGLATADSVYRQAYIFYLFMFVLAQTMFWLAFLLTKVGTRTLGIVSSRRHVLVYAVVMFLLSCAGYMATYLLFGGSFLWVGMVRDSVGLSISGVASFLLYRAILHIARGNPGVLGA
jgi:hypothetical protein